MTFPRPIAFIAALAAGAALAHAEADYSTPKNAMKTYTQAIANADIQVLKNSSVTTDKHVTLLENLVKYSTIDRKFREACIKAFPNAAKDLPDPTKQTLDSIETSDVKIEGDAATLQTRDSLEPVRLKRVDNRWKVDLVSMYDPESIDEVLMFWNVQAYVMNDMLGDVAGGKYKTFDEVRNMLEMRVKMRMALPQTEEPSTQPAN
jgi:hypothetical protein